MPTAPVTAWALGPQTPQQAWPGVLRPTGVPHGIEGDTAASGVWRCWNLDLDKDPRSFKMEQNLQILWTPSARPGRRGRSE